MGLKAPSRVRLPLSPPIITIKSLLLVKSFLSKITDHRFHYQFLSRLAVRRRIVDADFLPLARQIQRKHPAVILGRKASSQNIASLQSATHRQKCYGQLPFAPRCASAFPLACRLLCPKGYPLPRKPISDSTRTPQQAVMIWLYQRIFLSPHSVSCENTPSPPIGPLQSPPL